MMILNSFFVVQVQVAGPPLLMQDSQPNRRKLVPPISVSLWHHLRPRAFFKLLSFILAPQKFFSNKVEKGTTSRAMAIEEKQQKKNRLTYEPRWAKEMSRDLWDLEVLKRFDQTTAWKGWSIHTTNRELSHCRYRGNVEWHLTCLTWWHGTRWWEADFIRLNRCEINIISAGSE